MKRWFVLFCVTLLVGACSAIAGDTTDTNTAQTVEESTTAEDENALVRWNRDALSVVFQADVIGGIGYGTFIDNNRVPLCTIYGDGRLVWTSPDNNEVLFDFLTDEQITDFVTYLTVDERFFTYEGGMDTLMPSPEFPITDVMTLNVNDIEHTTDSFGNWTDDYFLRLSENCRALSQQPRRFQPSEGWFSIDAVVFDDTIPSVPWEADAAGLSLFDVAEMPASSVWLENSLVLPIWTAIRDNNGRVQFNQDGDEFLVALRIPGVTVDAPPPPSGDDNSLATEEPESEG